MQAWLALFLFALPYPAQAGENEIRQMLESKFPNKGKIEHIIKTPYSGLYEILIGDQLIYADERGEYLFDGSVIEVKSRANITEERHSKLIRVDFDNLPFDLAVKKVKGNGKRKLALFTDPNCEYCKRLEKELTKVSDITLYIFLYPIFQGSDEIVRNVSCSKDPVNAWDDLMLNGIAPASAVCKTFTDKVLALGKKLRMKGTPNLIFANGMRAPGYLSVEELEKSLNEVSKN
ncbi:MAG: DsbC family protein [Nitrospinae bacterium]|nr:DsbC family protein [Nitrospinota bacterium]MBF0633802.1 DsbC family protein [Nitrospinota bacterium]